MPQGKQFGNMLGLPYVKEEFNFVAGGQQTAKICIYLSIYLI